MVIDIPIMFFDGESSNNPGQGAAAAILLMPNGKRFTVSQLLSSVTTPEAEYRGLIIGLEKARKLGIHQLEVKGDSETVFNQINRLTSVAPDSLKPFNLEARKLMRYFKKVSVEYISEEQNRSARAAVRRCINDALGGETANPVATPTLSVLPMIAEIIALGENATEEDYRHLTLDALDEYSVKSLTELRPLIPTEVQDQIALRWNGKEEELEEMYRWYLRGLPPNMAISKVKLDNRDKRDPIPEKLPWEEALVVPTSLLDDEQEELPPLEELEGSSPDIADTSRPSLEPVDRQTQETFLSLPSLVTNEKLQETTLLSESNVEIKHSPVETPPSTSPSNTENSKDTLPDRTRVANILELIHNLSLSEKQQLTQELLQSKEMIQLITQAIATQLSVNS
ncbi:MAG: ribonuclease HI family protein [Microcystaceae cyanobacterium]